MIGRRERIKTSGKFRQLMCKNSENVAKSPTSRKSPRATHACAMACGSSSRARLSAGWWYDSGTGQSCAGLGAWPVPFDAGPSQTLLWSWVQFSSPTSRPAFGRVNASLSYTADNEILSIPSRLTRPISALCTTCKNSPLTWRSVMVSNRGR